jgi:hypothetical protein
MDNQFSKESIWLVVIVLLSAALACNLPGSGRDDSNPQNMDGIPKITQLSDDGDQTGDDVITPDSGSAFVNPGFSRANPYVIETEVQTPYWDFKVLEIVRGEDAWQALQTEDPTVLPPPTGKQYLLIKLWLRNKNPSPEVQNISLDEFFVTGDSLQVHSDVLKDLPGPEIVYTDIFTAEILEGWIDVLINPTEGNLMLVFDRNEYIDGESTPREVRYLAIDRGASIEIPDELDALTPNDLGLTLENPAKIGETVIGDNWEVTVLESVQGEAALDLVMKMNDNNKPPEEGLEYIVFRARFRRISTADRIENHDNFQIYAPGLGQHNSDFLSEPRGVFNRNRTEFPRMEFYFFPGTVSEGWFVMAGPASQNPQIARLKVGDDFKTGSRYFQLSP